MLKKHLLLLLLLLLQMFVETVIFVGFTVCNETAFI